MHHRSDALHTADSAQIELAQYMLLFNQCFACVVCEVGTKLSSSHSLSVSHECNTTAKSTTFRAYTVCMMQGERLTEREEKRERERQARQEGRRGESPGLLP